MLSCLLLWASRVLASRDSSWADKEPECIRLVHADALRHALAVASA